MSNPSGDALIASGIRDTQKMSGGELRRVLADGKGANVWSNVGGIALGVVVVAFVTAFLVL